MRVLVVIFFLLVSNFANAQEDFFQTVLNCQIKPNKIIGLIPQSFYFDKFAVDNYEVQSFEILINSAEFERQILSRMNLDTKAQALAPFSLRALLSLKMDISPESDTILQKMEQLVSKEAKVRDELEDALTKALEIPIQKIKGGMRVELLFDDKTNSWSLFSDFVLSGDKVELLVNQDRPELDQIKVIESYNKSEKSYKLECQGFRVIYDIFQKTLDLALN